VGATLTLPFALPGQITMNRDGGHQHSMQSELLIDDSIHYNKYSLL